MSEPEEDDFEKMFEASQQARRIEKGRTIDGTVVAIGEESALVDVGGKSEAEIDIGELKDEDGDLEVAVGDRIQATVVSTAGGLKLSRKLALGAVSARQLEDAFRAGLPAAIGEVLEGPVVLSIYVQDRAATARFTGDGFVLPGTARRGIPVVTVNMDVAEMKLFRVGDDGHPDTNTAPEPPLPTRG